MKHLIWILLLCGNALGAQTPHVDVTPILETGSGSETLALNQPFLAGAHFKVDEGWHIYWRNPGDSGQPTEIRWQLPEGYLVGPLQWPTPTRLPLPPLMNYGLENDVVLFHEIKSSRQSSDIDVVLKAEVRWLVCKDVCLPGKKSLEWKARFSKEKLQNKRSPLFEKALAKLPAARFNGTWRLEAENQNSDGKKLVLRVQTDKTDITDAYFYAFDESLIKHSAPQNFSRTTNGFSLQLPIANHDSKPTKTPFRGLLATEGKDAQAAEIEIEVPSRWTPLVQALIFAFLGGMILNLMPCVFPVLFIKILGFIEISGKSRRKAVSHSGAYALGILSSFWALGGILILFRTAGTQLGWGFQLQSPPFVLGLAFLFTLMALNLLGVFEVLLPVGNLGHRLTSRGGILGTFFSGILATVVATPCTAPFMGSALGYGMAQSGAISLLVFTFLGAGLAFPYMVLSISPGMMKFLPRPGAWMERLKQVMAFPLFATVLWLLWVFGSQTNLDSVMYALGWLLVFSFGLWILGWKTRKKSGRWIVALGLVGLALLGSGRLSLVGPQSSSNQSAGPHSSNQWKDFTPTVLEGALQTSQPVFLDFTAAWCITCQVNDKAVFQRQDVRDLFVQKNVILIRADWTNANQAITNQLAAFGRNGVPLYVLYRPGKRNQPEILPQVLTPGSFINLLQSL